MSAIKFLAAAYIATWMIHGTYLATLGRRFSRLKKEMNELRKGRSGPLL